MCHGGLGHSTRPMAWIQGIRNQVQLRNHLWKKRVKDVGVEPDVDSRAGIWEQIQNKEEGERERSRHPRTGYRGGALHMKEPINKQINKW